MGWELIETIHTIHVREVEGVVAAPDLQLCGSRFYYHFTGDVPYFQIVSVDFIFFSELT